jgi:hypothetical protein
MKATIACRPKVLLVPEPSLYLAFRLPMLFEKAGWDVDLLCLAGELMVHSRYVSTCIEEKTTDALFNRLQSILRDPLRPWQAFIVVDERIARRLFATGDPELLQHWQPGAMEPQVRDFLVSKSGLEIASRNPLLMSSRRMALVAAVW